MRIAVSGPAASGKGTAARAFARMHGLDYVDVGTIFRFVAYSTEITKSLSLEEIGEAYEANEWLYVWSSSGSDIIFGEESLANKLAEPAVADATSRLAATESAFRKMIDVAERVLVSRFNLIADGRSVGTVLLQGADHKFYLDANLEVRALRRHNELLNRGIASTLEETRDALHERDLRDKERATDPLRIASDASVIDTSYMTVEQVIAQMTSHL